MSDITKNNLFNRKAIIITACVCILIVISTYTALHIHQAKLEKAASVVSNTGYIEAKSVNTGFKVAGRIDKIFVEEGDQVKKGQIIAQLETTEIEAKLKQSEGAMEAATAKHTEAQEAISLQSDTTASQIKAAKADYDIKKLSYKRIEDLFAQGAVSQQKRDEALAAMDAAEATWQSAVASEKQVSIRTSEANAAAGAMTQAEGARDEAQAYLDNCYLKAPCDGIITLSTMEEGEMVSAGTPVFEITDLVHTWVEINVPENKIGQVQLQQKAIVTVDSYPNKVFKGKVVWINDAGDFAVKKAISEMEQHDIRTFKVKITIPNNKMELKTGMTAVATLN